eukprot:TRINITY_DN23251_c0_g1_i1.p1 TRINITY_DN23251_c0_g1~~TRINITY_DN23251_c0_g1_i1.p1  ORF type:complete len:485 (-),score=52.55 TRINITY_DN23251_c0_g1_i1:872-2326(-)
MHAIPQTGTELLQTGLLEGKLVYYRKKRAGCISLQGIVCSGLIQCSCNKCIQQEGGSRLLPRDFELHAGSAAKKSSENIYTQNGFSLCDLLMIANREASGSEEAARKEVADALLSNGPEEGCFSDVKFRNFQRKKSRMKCTEAVVDRFGLKERKKADGQAASGKQGTSSSGLPCISGEGTPKKCCRGRPIASKSKKRKLAVDGANKNIAGTDHYEVAKIVGHLESQDGSPNSQKFCVSWVGWPPSANSWVAKKDLNCDILLEEYSQRLKKTLGGSTNGHDESSKQQPDAFTKGSNEPLKQLPETSVVPSSQTDFSNVGLAVSLAECPGRPSQVWERETTNCPSLIVTESPLFAKADCHASMRVASEAGEKFASRDGRGTVGGAGAVSEKSKAAQISKAGERGVKIHVKIEEGARAVKAPQSRVVVKVEESNSNVSPQRPTDAFEDLGLKLPACMVAVDEEEGEGGGGGTPDLSLGTGATAAAKA